MGEHFMMDGTSTHRLNEYVNDAIFNNKLDFSDSSVRSNIPDPAEIKFHVNKEILADIERAQKDFSEVIGTHELAVKAYQGYGKDQEAGMLSRRLCPDDHPVSLLQDVWQEQTDLRARHDASIQQGRTEVCRTVSDEPVAFCKAMVDSSVNVQETAALFHRALKAHVEYFSAAADWKGVERHLLGLKKLLGSEDVVPPIFKDLAYSYSSTWYISTSSDLRIF
ncbi:acyltransferase ChoActase/COT/CPT [Aspergillus foveolatus]|uniref:acyltransferase ChoActase/COT/CPT n=1 Tax=Aspergillus foveolatus TaxID=210207 RepID=UPI003CCDDD59